jgi:hypothetical protein
MSIRLLGPGVMEDTKQNSTKLERSVDVIDQIRATS